MVISKSDIVVSTNGRDSGKAFFVLDTENGYALLANGKGRRVEAPKRKKIKHVKHFSSEGGRVSEKIRNGEKVTNSDLRKALAEYAGGISEV